MAQDDGEDRREEPRVGVYQSHRMADPAVPDDVMHGKRFVDPATGRPASIVDILQGMGVIGPGKDAEDGPEKG